MLALIQPIHGHLPKGLRKLAHTFLGHLPLPFWSQVCQFVVSQSRGSVQFAVLNLCKTQPEMIALDRFRRLWYTRRWTVPSARLIEPSGGFHGETSLVKLEDDG